MKYSILAILLTLAVGSSLCPTVQAETLKATTFKDQWEKSQTLDKDTRWLVVSQSMKAGDIVKETFEKLEVEAPAQHGMLYLADVSGMPGIITKLFALPAMRDYAFPIALIREDGELATMNMPIEDEEAVTVFALDGLNVAEVLVFEEHAKFEAFLRKQVMVASE